MAAVVAFPAVPYNHANGTMAIPNGHAFHAHFDLMGVANAAAGTRDYSIQSVQMLALSLSRRNPANVAELDNTLYGVHSINEAAVCHAVAQAVNAGFAHGVVATGDTNADGFAVIRRAQVWAQANPTRLYSLMAANFYVLPALPGSAAKGHSAETAPNA